MPQLLIEDLRLEDIMREDLVLLEQEFQKKATEAWEITWNILNMSEGWKQETGSNLQTGIVYSRNFQKLGKLYKLEAYIEAGPEDTFDEIIGNAHATPTWNTTVREFKILQSIDDSTDICYNVCAEAAGGLVSSRDFVNLRHWKTRDDIILSAGCAVMHPDAPVNKKHVRGENRPGGWIFKPVPEHPNRTMFVWICNTDLKGWIPQYVVDQAFSATLLDFCKHLQRRMYQVQQNNHHSHHHHRR